MDANAPRTELGLMAPESGDSRPEYRLRSHDCCISSGEPETVELFQLRALASLGREQHFSHHTISSSEELNHRLKGEDSLLYDVQIFSLSQQNSWAPLDVSESTLLEIFRNQDVNPEFINVVEAFAAKGGVSTGNADCGYWFWLRSSDRIQVSYTFKYPEKRERLGEPWSLRKTAVYHCMVPREGHSCWILLHPSRHSAGYTRLLSRLSDRNSSQELLKEPLKQHVLLMSEYLPNWELFLSHYEREIMSIANSIEPHTFTEEFEPTHPDYLIRLRFIESCILPLLPILSSHAETFQGLQELNRTLGEELSVPLDNVVEMDCILRNLSRQNEAHLRTARFLVGKVSRLAQLLRDILMIHNQTAVRVQTETLTSLNKFSNSQNEDVHRLSTASLRESSAVKLIALVTLGFLPIQVIATMFGTNFVYLTPSRSLAVSPDIWIMFAIATPVTILTMGYWFIRQWQERSRIKLEQSSRDDAVV